MLIFLLICIIVLICSIAYLYIKLKSEKENKRKIEVEKLKLEKEKFSEKDLKFIEFTVDMYIKYSKEFGIHSNDQHEYIIGELERIKRQYLDEKMDN